MYSPEEMGKNELTLSVNGKGFVNISGESTRFSEYITNMIPMQYTGLKDKNGKEIYEGDMLQCTNRQDTEYKPLLEVDFLNGCFTIGTCNAHEFYSIFQSDPEIIGNIHENPKLLK